MKKTVILLSILFTLIISFANANFENNSQLNDNESEVCKKLAFYYANENEADYGSENWQLIYTLAKKYCEAELL